MLHHSSGPRAGITLVEVLAAIFIMGVGLLALLTLFPLGALSMARAVRDDRAAAAAANGAALATALDFRNNSDVVAGLTGRPAGFLAPDPNGPGYPVYLDPYYTSFSSTLGDRAGTTPGVIRKNGGYTNPAQIARLFSVLDEITFDIDGRPVGSPTGVTRPSTYTWAYLIRTPRTSSRELTEVAVVVYSGRSLDLQRGETTYAASSADPTANPAIPINIVSINWTAGADKPRVRKGTWVLDTSYTSAGRFSGSVNGYFYQVAGTRDTGATSMDLELESNLRAPTPVNTIVVMENVVRVLERGTGWKP
jgi:type II secretory pathway pseudopilin PulG